MHIQPYQGCGKRSTVMAIAIKLQLRPSEEHTLGAPEAARSSQITKAINRSSQILSTTDLFALCGIVLSNPKK